MLHSTEHDFIMFIDVKMPTIVISMINIRSESGKQEQVSILVFNEPFEISCSGELSMKKVLQPEAISLKLLT